MGHPVKILFIIIVIVIARLYTVQGWEDTLI